MLPLCSAMPSCSHSQILLNDGLRNFSRFQKSLDISCLSEDIALSSLSSGVRLLGMPLPKAVANSLYSDFLGRHKLLSNDWQYTSGKISDLFFIGKEHLKYIEDSTTIISKEENLRDSTTIISKEENLRDIFAENNDVLLEPSNKEPMSILDNVDAFGMDMDSSPTSASNFENFLSQTNKSLGASINKGENALNSSVDRVTSTITGIVNDSNEAIENLTRKVFSFVDQTGELSRNRLIDLPSELKEASSKVSFVALDLLRKTIIVVEDSLVKGTKVVSYSYESFKDVLPQEIQNALISFEERASEISRPVGMVFLQVYSGIEELERSLGLDPSDPIVPFVLFLGTTSTLWAVYWVITYSGYAGDLSPKLAFELLTGKDDAVLIDVRPEALRERDGIPDLRRTARFRYANVSLAEVDGSLRKLMKSSRDLDDTLIAAVIRNLKNVRDRSKIIIMDADGSRAKGIARSLRKLGIKRPYVVQGGFQSWVKEGLRIKELKPETAITILNEEAEAILEELSPTPLQLLGIGVGSIAALYALVEWEKSLQLIGVLGLGQTIYRRVASYEDPEDFRKDVRWLFSPVTLGAQALSWAAGKGESKGNGNGNGLPVLPSSSDVQSRVLQAAAKHESQPFDAEGSQDTPLDPTVDQSEA